MSLLLKGHMNEKEKKITLKQAKYGKKKKIIMN